MVLASFWSMKKSGSALISRLRHRLGLDHEEPVIRRRRPLLRDVVEQIVLRDDVEDRGALDLLRVIEAHAMQHPRAAVVAGGHEALEAERRHHLDLVLRHSAEAAEGLAPRVRSAGCLFVGEHSGTAFGDYVAGSNHTVPTEGAARFASGLNVRHFRRRMAEVRIPPHAAAGLAGPGAAIARAEGFEAHAASMEARRENQRDEPHR